MTDVTGEPVPPRENPGAHSTVLHDRRRPGRREVAPELVHLLRGQGPVLVEPDEEAGSGPVREQRDDLACVSGVMRGLCIASLGWAVAISFLVLR